MTADLVSIDEAAERTGLSTEDVEYAEQIGLLAGHREAEGYYTPEQMRLLEGLACLRQLGLALGEIRDLNLTEDVLAEIEEYLGFPRRGKPSLDTSAAFLKASIQVLRSHEGVVDEQIRSLQALRQSLDRRAATFRKLLKILQERSRRAA